MNINSIPYEEQIRINTIKDAFQTFDKDNDGYINYDEIVTIIRSMNYIPTEKELNDFIPDRFKRYDFIEFFNIMNNFKSPVSLDFILDKAKLYDYEGNGTVIAPHMIHSMTTSGENISEEELTEEVFKKLTSSDISNPNTKVNINDIFKYMSS